MDFEEYKSIDALNISALLKLRRSPKHFRHYADHGQSDTKPFALGRATHTGVLEPHQFLREYALWPASNGARRGKAFAEFKEANRGKQILTEKEYAHALDMARAVSSDPVASLYLRSPSESEVTLEWDTDGRTCKGRIDLLNEYIVDIKTTKDATPRGFARASASYGYHLRAAWYVDGVFATRGTWMPFVMICVEKAPPFDVVVYEVPSHIIAAGRDEYRSLLEKLRQHEESGEWPGIADGQALDLELPSWALSDVEELIIDGEKVSL